MPVRSLLCCTLLCSMTALVSAEPPVGERSPESPQETAPQAGRAVPVVALMEPGAEPRRELRLAPQVGAEQRVKLLMRLNKRETVGAFPAADVNLPEIAYTIKVQVVEVADGTIGYRMEFTDATVEESQGVHPRTLDALKRAAAAVVGVTARAEATDRGIVTAIAFERRPGDPGGAQQIQSITDSLRWLTVPLPQEPIGEGGKWQVYSVFQSGGFTVEATTVYTLTRLGEDGYEAEMSIDMDAEEQESADAPAGTTQRLLSIDADGRGSARQLLSHVLPRSMTVTTRTTMLSDVEAPQITMNMKQFVRQVVMLREAEEAAQEPPAEGE